jgi:hypothetical protein
MMESKIVYFDKPGKENTDAVFQVARERAKALGIKTIIVASTTGETAAKAVDAFKGFKVVIVTHVMGSREPNVNPMSEENRHKVVSNGGIIVTAAHAFGSIDRAMHRSFNMVGLGETIAHVLRVLGQGMKVVCEISLMAADAGAVRTDEEVVAIGGTGRGSDTAVVLNPVNTTDFFNLRVKEILCKPRLEPVNRQPEMPPAR